MTNAELATTATNPAVAEQAANVAPAKLSTKKGATTKRSSTKAKKTAKGAKQKPAKRAAKPTAERSNKKAEVIAMMKRAKGVTLAETYRPGFRQYCREQGWRNDRIVHERSRGADVQNREVGQFPTNAAPGNQIGAPNVRNEVSMRAGGIGRHLAAWRSRDDAAICRPAQ